MSATDWSLSAGRMLDASGLQRSAAWSNVVLPVVTNSCVSVKKFPVRACPGMAGGSGGGGGGDGGEGTGGDAKKSRGMGVAIALHARQTVLQRTNRSVMTASEPRDKVTTVVRQKEGVPAGADTAWPRTRGTRRRTHKDRACDAAARRASCCWDSSSSPVYFTQYRSQQFPTARRLRGR